MERRAFLVRAGILAATALAGAGCTTTRPDTLENRTARRREIDSGADAALTRLYSTARGSRELANRAQGILIFPRVLSGGLIVGGEYGDGVLRSGARATGYYRIVGRSFGWQAGVQSQVIIPMFLTQECPQSIP